MWRKSSYSASGSNCVEVNTQGWRTSTYSGGNSNDCVEVTEWYFPAGFMRKQLDIILRDSKNPEGLVFRFDTSEWRKFINDVKADRYKK